jgi:hypothetical protein
MALLPDRVDESRSTHGFFLFPRLSALTEVLAAVGMFSTDIRDARRMNKRNNCKARKEMAINVQAT